MDNVFCNQRILMNIRETKRNLIMHYDSGTMYVTNRADLKGYGINIWEAVQLEDTLVQELKN